MVSPPRLLALAPLVLAGCVAPQAPVAQAPALHAQSYGAARDARTLLVVLHDDDAANHQRFAEAASRAVPTSTAVALLRPGYADAAGNASPGIRGAGTGDNYTREQVAAVGDAIAMMRRRNPAARVVVIGQGGGAAIAADLAGIRPDLVDGIVLAGCPCALPEWRRQMRWSDPVDSLDPLQTAGGIAPGLRAAVLVGADDKVTPVKLSRAYAEALTLRGVATDYRIVPGKGHDLLDDPELLAATQRLAASLPRKN